MTFKSMKTNCYVPYMTKGTKQLIKGDFLKGKGKQKGDDLEDKGKHKRSNKTL